MKTLRNCCLLFVIILIPYILTANPFSSKINRGNTKIHSFRKAKTLLLLLYKKKPNRVTFYCGCSWSEDKKVSHISCGYKPRRTRTRSGKLNERAYRIEWEHVVPAHKFGKNFKEWTDGHPKCGKKKGRRCAEKTNELFRFMLSDLYNLVPAIGEVNANRSNFVMAVIPGESREYGECDVEITNGKAEPVETIRGNVARIYLYMNWAYPNIKILTEKDKKLFSVWNNADPVDAWECALAKSIEKLQRNENPFVKQPCLTSGNW